MKSRLLMLAMSAALLGTLALGAMSFDEGAAASVPEPVGRTAIFVRVIFGLAS